MALKYGSKKSGIQLRSGSGVPFKQMGSSPANLIIPLDNPTNQNKTKTYKDLEKEGGDVEAAKKWNMKTYGTENPTADAKKAGLTKEELSKQFKTPKGKTNEHEVKHPVIPKKGPEGVPNETVTKTDATASEKTKRLESKVLKKDQQTADAYVEKELAESRVGKYGKGLFGGSLRRARAKGKYKRKGRQEDRSRENLAESKAYDKLTPEQKAAKKAANRKELSEGLMDAGQHIGGKRNFVEAQNERANTKIKNEQSKRSIDLANRKMDYSEEKYKTDLVSQNILDQSRQLNIDAKIAAENNKNQITETDLYSVDGEGNAEMTVEQKVAQTTKPV